MNEVVYRPPPIHTKTSMLHSEFVRRPFLIWYDYQCPDVHCGALQLCAPAYTLVRAPMQPTCALQMCAPASQVRDTACIMTACPRAALVHAHAPPHVCNGVRATAYTMTVHAYTCALHHHMCVTGCALLRTHCTTCETVCATAYTHAHCTTCM